ncbi:DUF6223 family protein [Streptomyces sp. NPDC048603]|uniref:DUF6223 family protein n=1 Tax=Streptomyces sp. NPDC048603 TaxID=3365577 RepID=UPI003720DC1D
MSADHLLAASVYTFSLGRVGAATGALLGLLGVIVAWRALSRPTGRPGATPAVVAGLVSVTLGGLVVATAEGGVGTGNGLGGAYVALLFGLTATALGSWALSRSRRTR